MSRFIHLATVCECKTSNLLTQRKTNHHQFASSLFHTHKFTVSLTKQEIDVAARTSISERTNKNATHKSVIIFITTTLTTCANCFSHHQSNDSIKDNKQHIQFIYLFIFSFISCIYFIAQFIFHVILHQMKLN